MQTTESCTDGKCVACLTGKERCGATCVALDTDPANCGACGKACIDGKVCISGGCICPSGTYTCSGKCVDLLSDKDNCGACGKACPAGDVCAFAACEKVCTAPTTKCGGGCVDVTSDKDNCGACGKACATGETCTSGKCGCGSTGKVCSALEACVSGACSCKATTCGTLCTDLSTDASNCGVCGKTCSTGVPCLGGVCVTSTTVTFPTSAATTYTTGSIGTLGSGGGGSHYVTGDYVEEKLTRGAPVTKMDLDIKMSDSTSSYCTVGTLTWAVKINGASVGTYSWVGGFGGDKTVKQSFTFASITPVSGQVTVRLEATNTVCPGGGSWNWYPGGTATFY
ncbi:MAG: hypothetical protein JNL79_15670 [Myxococcales bacterium]|nr:hypothetical protein [Myxococcales bacterium]